MVDMFEKEICNYCKCENCEKNIEEFVNSNLRIYKCAEYVKNAEKIPHIQAPLLVTAERDYINYNER